MTTPTLVRHPVTLKVHVRYQGDRIVEKLSITADPDIPDDFRKHLTDAMWRVHRRRPDYIGDYDLLLWRDGRDRNPNQPYRTIAFTAKDKH